jgi:hypothetical protein
MQPFFTVIVTVIQYAVDGLTSTDPLKLPHEPTMIEKVCGVPPPTGQTVTVPDPVGVQPVSSDVVPA